MKPITEACYTGFPTAGFRNGAVFAEDM